MQKYVKRSTRDNADILSKTKSVDRQMDVMQQQHIVWKPIRAIQFKKKNNIEFSDSLGIRIEKPSEHNTNVHYNSSKSSTVQTYTQGSNIRVAQGQLKRGNKCETVQLLKENVFNINVTDKGFASAEGTSYMKRGASPTGGAWNTDAGNGLQLKKDHIIPYECIRNYVFACTRIAKDADNKKATAWVDEAIARTRQEQAKSYVGYGTAAYSDEEIYAAKKLANNEKIKDSVRNVAHDIIRASVTWIPGNIVMSPDPRGDDAHGGFDEPLLEIADKKIDYKTTYRKMENVNRNVLNRRELDENDLKSMRYIKNELVKIISKQKPYEYKSTQWKEKNGSYYVKKK